MSELTLTVIVEKELPPIVDGAVSFETGASPEQVRVVANNAYNHHGPGFTADAPGALARFYEDLLLGRSFPLKFATRALADFDVLFALALFLHRDLAVQPATPAVIAVVDTAHRLGFPYIAHLDPTFARFLGYLRTYFPTGLSKREQGERMATAVGWVREHLVDGRLPHMGEPAARMRVLDVGTNGFLFAQADGSLLEAWREAYRAGYLRGVVIGADRDGRRHVLAARKSPYLMFDLARAAEILNEMEGAMGEPAGWRAEPLWLHGPDEGTSILPTHMMEVLLRV